MSKHKIIYRISRRFFLSVILLATFSVVSYTVFYSVIRMLDSDSYVINLSGKQKFLSQKIALLSKELISENGRMSADSLKNELASALQKMEQGHSYLGHENKIMEHYHSPEIQKIYFSEPVLLDAQIHKYLQSAAKLASGASVDSLAAGYILSSSSRLLHDLDLIVQQYQAESSDHVHSLKWQQFTLLLLTLLLLYFVWKIVFNPAKKEIQYYISELIQKDNALIQANIDLEKKAAERASQIEKKDNIYKTLVDNMNEGLAHYNMNGIFTFVNDNYCRILGYDKEELIGQPIFKFFFPEDIEKIKHKLSLRKKNIGEKYEMKLPRKNGGTVWLQIHSTTIQELGEVTGVMVVITDISEKKNTQVLIEDLNNFNEILLHTIPLGMQVVDIEGNVLYSNEAMKKLAGVDTMGKKCWTVVHDGKAPCVSCIRITGIEQGKLNICELQEVFDGKTVHIYQSGISYHNTKAVLEVYIDITLLKQAEQKLAFKNKELQTFISRASHDMRSPVANILGLTAILQKKDTLDEKLFIDYIEQSAKRMDNVLIELINIGKVYNNSLNISAIDMEEMLISANQYLKKKEFETIRFLYKISMAGKFYSDQHLVYSILHNLVDNAAKYRAKINPQVTVLASEHKSGIRLQVTDNGQGMDREVQEKAFDMFYRGNLASNGSGLGLYMARTFAEKLGGDIRLKSEKGKGTAVTVFLPNLQKENANSPKQTVDNAHSLS